MSDIEYDAEAKLRTATALLDWHPGGRGFRLTAGAVYNDTRVEASSLPPPRAFYDIGGVPVPVGFVGTLDAEADFDPVVPYAGLGWGNAVGGSKKLGFFFDLGVVFQGKADVTADPDHPGEQPDQHHTGRPGSPRHPAETGGAGHRGRGRRLRSLSGGGDRVVVPVLRQRP